MATSPCYLCSGPRVRGQGAKGGADRQLTSGDAWVEVVVLRSGPCELECGPCSHVVCVSVRLQATGLGIGWRCQ